MTDRVAAGPAAEPDTRVDALWERLRVVEERVRWAVEARRAGDPDPDDPYRGQYLTPEAAARILDEPGGLGVPGPDPWQPPAEYDATDHVLYEAKGLTTRANVRMAIGQLLDY
ncbi:hypothetical protein AB0A67_33545, partial [Streptomyces eurythermus]